MKFSKKSLNKSMVFLVIGILAVLLIAGCSPAKTTKEESTTPAISGAATTTTTPIVVEEETVTSTTTPSVIPSDVTPVIITSDDTVETKSSSLETKSTESSTVAAGTIQTIGKKGFNPLKNTIKTGETITFLNKDPSERNVVITLQNEKTGKVTNSNQIPPGKTYEHTFDEVGEFKFWDVSYGVMGTIVVE